MELKTLIAECTAYDFKVMLEEKKPKSWLKSVSALANGLGGSLFYGMTTPNASSSGASTSCRLLRMALISRALMSSLVSYPFL